MRGGTAGPVAATPSARADDPPTEAPPPSPSPSTRRPAPPAGGPLGGAGHPRPARQARGSWLRRTGGRIRHELVRPRGNRLWDWIIRGTGLLGLLGILFVLAIPGTGPLVGFAVVTAWLTGPLSPLFPFGYEPIVMLMARLHGALLVTSVSVATMLLVEWIALHLYGEVLSLRALRSFRRHRWTRATRRLFGRAPFLAVWLVSWSPIPFWTVRILASLRRYSTRRYLAAVFLGRFPKILLFAWLGVIWQVSAWILGAAVAASLAVGLLAWLRRRGRRPEAEGVASDAEGGSP